MINPICGREDCDVTSLHWHLYHTEKDIDDLARLRKISRKEAERAINYWDRLRCAEGSNIYFNEIDKLRNEVRNEKAQTV